MGRWLLPQMSPPTSGRVQRTDVREVIRAMSTEAFRQGGRGAVPRLALEALPWGVSLESVTALVDVWHGWDGTIVRCEQAEILAAAMPGAQRHFLASHAC